VAAFNAVLFLIFLFYAVAIMGVGYILFRVYRERHRKVRKLR